ncbi:MAG: Stk1 family PASTA domain-containing Ser/Thr kinase [Clostridiales bacterium]|nr:Stk1 family PASTA domain-containing Ser/Thr kinase [Clostridiales bacterium]
MSSKVLAGRYELLEKIGDGGMAVVYRAMDKLLSRHVAVKILKPQFTGDEKFIENFRKESHAAARLTHANIVGVYDVGKEGNINYIVMELVKGKALSDIIKEEGPLDYRRVMDLSRQIASGLAAAHKAGIIHRDVKPHNILVNEDGVAKIADFGIAKAVSVNTIVENTEETIIGSVHYFSPEQARGGYVDERSDLYSLGIVMYEMLTGDVPFDGDNPVSIALMHINDPIIPPSKIVDGIPPALEKIVMKATDKIQINRYQTAEELIKALDEVDLLSSFDLNHRPKYHNGDTIVAGSRDELVAAGLLPDDPRGSQGGGKGNDKTKKKRALIMIGAGVALLVLIMVIGLATGKFSKKEIEVPDLHGMTYEQAEEQLKDRGLKIQKGDKVFSDDYEAGLIVAQDPREHTKVKEGTTVTVDLSIGASEGEVPYLIGMDEKEAVAAIEEAGFVYAGSTEETSTQPAGQVLSQTPEAGSKASPGSEISLVISNGQGKRQVTVPDLRGLTEDEARSKLENNGLYLGSVEYQISKTYPKGQIIDQQYAGGNKIDEGTSVSVVVSTGASSTINYYVDFSAAKEEVFYMTVTVTDDNGTRNVITNQQCAKVDEGISVEITGTGQGKIVVIFDNETVYEQSVDFAEGAM